VQIDQAVQQQFEREIEQAKHTELPDNDEDLDLD
jgi:hypothetical protein